MLPNVPPQPRGDEYSPVVLIVVGGVADCAIAALPSIVLGSQGCSERMAGSSADSSAERLQTFRMLGRRRRGCTVITARHEPTRKDVRGDGCMELLPAQEAAVARAPTDRQ